MKNAKNLLFVFYAILSLVMAILCGINYDTQNRLISLGLTLSSPIVFLVGCIFFITLSTVCFSIFILLEKGSK